MPTSLYDVTVSTYAQILEAVSGFLDKGLAHCESNSVNLDDFVQARIHPDMMPFQFQIISVAHHSLGAMKGVQEGIFGPPDFSSELDYGGLQNLVAEAKAGIQQLNPDTVNALEGNEVLFKLGERSLPFIAKDFLLSFSLPNFFFHVTTAYDILRMKGVSVGKRDFLGQLRMKT